MIKPEDLRKFYDLMKENINKYNKLRRDPQSNALGYVPLNADVRNEMRDLVRLSLLVTTNEAGDIKSARIVSSYGGNPGLTKHWKIKSLEFCTLSDEEAFDVPEK